MATREAIRQRLASTGHNLEDLVGYSFIFCFVVVVVVFIDHVAVVLLLL